MKLQCLANNSQTTYDLAQAARLNEDSPIQPQLGIESYRVWLALGQLSTHLCLPHANMYYTGQTRRNIYVYTKEEIAIIYCL